MVRKCVQVTCVATGSKCCILQDFQIAEGMLFLAGSITDHLDNGLQSSRKMMLHQTTDCDLTAELKKADERAHWLERLGGTYQIHATTKSVNYVCGNTGQVCDSWLTVF